MLCIIVYAIIYKHMAKDHFHNMRDNNLIDGFYLSVSIMSTTGYNETTPKTDKGKIVVISQLFLIIILAGAFITGLSHFFIHI